MSKRIFSLLLAVVMMAGVFTAFGMTAYAADEEEPTPVPDAVYFNGGKIYAEIPDEWDPVKNEVFCHVWANGGDQYAAWQTKAERMVEEANGTWSFEIPAGNWNMIIISRRDYGQTYDLTFGNACIGDTVLIDVETQIENPIDSEKSGAQATWKNKSDLFGPKKMITSIGNVVGTHLFKDEVDPETGLVAKGNGVASVVTAEDYEPSTLIKGDVNGDSKVTMRDLLDIQKHIARVKLLTEEQQKAADVDGDGKIAMRDVMRIQRYIAKLIPAL